MITITPVRRVRKTLYSYKLKYMGIEYKYNHNVSRFTHILYLTTKDYIKCSTEEEMIEALINKLKPRC